MPLGILSASLKDFFLYRKSKQAHPSGKRSITSRRACAYLIARKRSLIQRETKTERTRWQKGAVLTGSCFFPLLFQISPGRCAKATGRQMEGMRQFIKKIYFHCINGCPCQNLYEAVKELEVFQCGYFTSTECLSSSVNTSWMKWMLFIHLSITVNYPWKQLPCAGCLHLNNNRNGSWGWCKT